MPPAPRPRFDGDPFAIRKMENVDKPDPDPVKEVARLIKLGKESFASGEFGAASEQFERAIATAPKDALPVFMKAQAAFAAGRYDDAVKLIRAGLDLDRNWPSGPFDPKELCGGNPGLFNDLLATLRGVIAANPGEPTLEFLLGYELWFIGEKVEAKKWFDLAEKRLPAPGPIALFK
jgi:tetratricopeptide (TPR) repeat protein